MSDGARQYSPGDLVPGTIYRVLRHLATGGMGSVYDVEDTTVGKRYVLKTLHPNLVSRSDLARRMAAEARALGRLSHPNIVEVVTAGQTSEAQPLPFYVMERLNGNNLRSVIDKRGALPEDQALPIAIELLDALDHAHEHQVVHRDVKPENIFLHRSMTGGVVTKLLDFGIMRMVDESRAQGGANDTAGRFVGTLRYAAPEQILGGQVGPGTDLYAAAIVIYEMLAGRGPFDDAFDVTRLGYAHLNEKPPPLSKLARVSPALERIVMSGLEKSPADRPRDAFTFAGQLKAIAKRDTRKTERAQETATDVHVLSKLPDQAVPARPMRGVDLAEAVTVAAGQPAEPAPLLAASPPHDPALPYAQTAMSDAGAPVYAATMPDSVSPATLQSNASAHPGVVIDRQADTRSISPKSVEAMGIGSTERLVGGPASNRASGAAFVPPAGPAHVAAAQPVRASNPSFSEASGPLVHASSDANAHTNGGAEVATRPRERAVWPFFVVGFFLVLLGGGAALKVIVLPRILGDAASKPATSTAPPEASPPSAPATSAPSAAPSVPASAPASAAGPGVSAPTAAATAGRKPSPTVVPAKAPAAKPPTPSAKPAGESPPIGL